jgi:glycosyltransferase involved in cell wall biosynthesis
MDIIHLIVGTTNPFQMNGTSKVVHELATRQQAAGYNVSVWSISSDKGHDLPRPTYTTRTFSKRRSPFTLPRDLERAIMRENRWTVFHIHGAFRPVIYAAASLMEDRDIPYIITPHGSYNEPAMRKNSLVKMMYFRWFELPTLRGAGAIHLFNDSEAESMQEWYHSKKTVRLPFGLDVVENTAKINSENTPFIIGYCGRLAMRKNGLDLLISGFQRFHKVHPESRLWIIGDGEDREMLYQIVAEQGLEQSVIWHGAQYGEDKLRLIQQCDVFAHTSRNEGLPASILEAAALGIPLLITEGTNAGKCVRDYGAGIVLNEACVADVAEGMIRLYKDIVMLRGAGRLRSAATRMINEVFSWDKLVGKYGQMYKRAMAS